MKQFLTIFLTFTFYLSANSQDKKALLYGQEIELDSLKKTVYTLADQLFEGRESGEEGEKKAAVYLKSKFKNYQIDPALVGTYYQSIETNERTRASTKCMVNGVDYDKCYDYKNSYGNERIITGDEIIFLGYANYDNSFNEYESVDVKNKLVMIFKSDGPYNQEGEKCDKTTSYERLQYLKKQEPKAIIIIEQGFRKYSNSRSSKKMMYQTPEADIPIITINELLANSILQTTGKTVKLLQYEYEKDCQPHGFTFSQSVEFHGKYKYDYSSLSNVVARIEGSDLKKETVVLVAHFDHIGKLRNDKYYPGANDNASGVAAIVEMARILRMAKKDGKGPRRTILLILATAEETGLNGSRYYTNYPIYPLDSTIACLNIDMLGRVSTPVVQHLDTNKHMYILAGKMQENARLYAMVDSINTTYNTEFVLNEDGPKNQNFFGRSDHYNFFLNGVPSMFFTDGVLEDLHRTTDTADKINYELLKMRTQLAFYTVWHLANSDDASRLLEPQNRPNKVRGN